MSDKKKKSWWEKARDEVMGNVSEGVKKDAKVRDAIMSGAGDRRDKYLRELEEYSTGKRKKKPRK